MKKLILSIFLLSVVQIFAQHKAQTDIANDFWRNDPNNLVKGLVTGATVFHAYGENTDVGTTLEDINNTNASLVYIKAAHRIKVVSTSVNDITGGTGIRRVVVTGLDEDWEPISTILIMSGTDSVSSASTIQFIRVFRIEADSVGSGAAAAGTIKLVTKNLDTLLAQINIATNQSLQARYTIPANKYGYLGSFHATTNVATKANTIYLRARGFGKPWIIIVPIEINARPWKFDFTMPYEFTEKTDIEIQALSASGSGSIAVGVTGWYEP